MDSPPSSPVPSSEIFEVEEADAGLRVDRFLTYRLPDLTRTHIQAVIKQGGVLLNGEVSRASTPVRVGDEVSWQDIPREAEETFQAEDIPLDILYEDEQLLVINKPAGMVVHPGSGNWQGTLVSALLHHYQNLPELGGADRPGIVHRLDKETSGCLVVAKTDFAHQALAKQFADRTVKKTYLALTARRPKSPAGTINAPIGRHPIDRKRMTIAEEGRGRDAQTVYRMLAFEAKRCLIECQPRTGRTHQIRLHLRHIGCPVLGDTLYGRRDQYDRHMLHAWKLEFDHPVSGERIKAEAPAPASFSIQGFPRKVG